jgi:hypothetical protein
MPLYTITIQVRVEAEDADAAQEQAFSLCNMLSPARMDDVGDPPQVRSIDYTRLEGPEMLTRTPPNAVLSDPPHEHGWQSLDLDQPDDAVIALVSTDRLSHSNREWQPPETRMYTIRELRAVFGLPPRS